MTPDALTPHELNTGFTWPTHPGPYRRLTDEQVRAYDAQGFFLFENAFDADTLAGVIEAIDPYENKLNDMLTKAKDGRMFIARANEITFTTHLVQLSELLRDFCACDVFQDLGHDLIGPDVRLYWDQAVYKRPGSPSPFPWHQDNGYTFVTPQDYLTCWVALTDATTDNGCPWVVPGLHRGGTYEHRLTELGYVCIEGWPEEAVPVEAKAGDIVVFTSLTPHATGPNTTDETRKSYIVQFAPDGAIIHQGANGRYQEVPATAPKRQYSILVNGRPPTGGA